ncbi:response regulator transcription factor [Paenibacillus koleovorans]|uniref:response regulator transcription factor n=1 Tax=Paenibacillus koleovorans TaxID=121608 RepID=UPI000FDC00FD|nr:response regulator [Paenibacillus koleovorans]
MNLLIVDDEKITRDTLWNFIPWRELGIKRIESARNGLEAIQTLSNFLPDILLTDIRMPRMNGIELAQHIRNLLPVCPIIFMSGYSDKTYLLSAIRLSASSYIEKPIQLEEVEKEVNKAIDICRTYRQSSLLSLKQELVMEILKPDIDFNHPRLLLLLKHFNLSPSHSCLAVLVFINLPDNKNSAERSAIQNEILESIALMNDVFPMTLESDKIALAIYRTDMSGAKDDEARTQFLRHLSTQISASHPCTVSFIIGRYSATTTTFHDSLNFALESVPMHFILGYGSIVDGNVIRGDTFKLEPFFYKHFKAFIHKSRSEEITKFIRDITTAISNYPRTDMNTVKNIYFHLLLALYQDTSSEHSSDTESVWEGNYFWHDIDEFCTLEDLADYVVTVANERLAEPISPAAKHGSISLIMQYIHEHYEDEKLSVSVLAKHAYLRHTYLCFLFKKQTGKTVYEYITEYRIKKAIELMKNDTLKLIDIAVAVGFTDANRFGRYFKRYVGVTPSEYRKR